MVALLDERAHDDTVGIVVDDRSWTWREVVRESARWSAAIATLRTGTGPFHVGVLLGNRPEYLFALFGAARAGAVLVGVNETRRGDELARDIRHTDCLAVLTDAAHVGLLTGLDLGGAVVLDVDGPDWRELVATAPAPPPAPVTATDVLLLIFTSGSTGAPKAVQLSHARACRVANAASWFGPDDVLYCAMPLFHGNALNAIVFPALATGATIALRERFSASQFMPDVRAYGATFFSTVGRALAYILATPESAADRDHRVKFALAPESSPRDLRACTTRFGILCVAGYGSSENVIIMEPRAGLPKDALGIPQAGIDAAVVDPETGVECPSARFDADGRLVNGAEAIGEIVGRNVVDRFEGYYRNPEAEAERTRNGWYWSGDLGYRDTDGVFYFAGRAGRVAPRRLRELRHRTRGADPGPVPGDERGRGVPGPRRAHRGRPGHGRARARRRHPVRSRGVRSVPRRPTRPRHEVGTALRAGHDASRRRHEQDRQATAAISAVVHRRSGLLASAR